MCCPLEKNSESDPDDGLPNKLRTLIDAAQAGDSVARDELLVANLGTLRRFIRRRLGHKLRARETSQDLAQSVCREVLSDLESFEYRGEGSFESWLLTRAENKIRKRATYWNREQRDLGREEVGDLEKLASFATPSRHMVTKERLAEVERAFAGLAPDYQQVILLSRVDGLPHEEVAERMGRTVSATWNLLYRGLAQLAQGLE